MTLNKRVYDLRGIISKYRLADDSRLDDRLLKEWIHTTRAVWIRRESSKGGWQIDPQITQDIHMPLKVTDRSKVSNLVTGGSVLVTTQELPKVIELRNKSGVLDVGPIDVLALPFSFVPLHRVRTFGNGRFNSTAICSFLYGAKIYLWSKLTNESFYKYIRYIGVNAIFSDPTEAKQFNHIDGTPCYNDDMDYPMNRWMWDFVREEILKANFDKLKKATEDTTNDASSEEQ